MLDIFRGILSKDFNEMYFNFLKTNSLIEYRTLYVKHQMQHDPALYINVIRNLYYIYNNILQCKRIINKIKHRLNFFKFAKNIQY